MYVMHSGTGTYSTVVYVAMEVAYRSNAHHGTAMKYILHIYVNWWVVCRWKSVMRYAPIAVRMNPYCVLGLHFHRFCGRELRITIRRRNDPTKHDYHIPPVRCHCGRWMHRNCQIGSKNLVRLQLLLQLVAYDMKIYWDCAPNDWNHFRSEIPVASLQGRPVYGVMPVLPYKTSSS